ncbi:MAG: extracellular matrix/biofilm biosynthesis regulator RemA family protein [Anaerotignaceae bacterium]
MNYSNFVGIGFGSVVNASRVVALVSPDSAPIKRLIQEAKEKGTLVDSTYGRKTRSVLIMDSGHIVLSLITPETIGSRLSTTVENEE